MNELLLTALRAFAIYLLMLVVIRALGKRTVGNFAAFDLLVALMLGELVDEIIYGDVSFLQGTVAIVVVAAAQLGNAWLSARGADKMLEGVPTVIIRDGRIVEKGLRKEWMNVRDAMAHLRQAGIHDLREVHLATVEDDGKVSVLLRDWAQPATRADVDEDAASKRRGDLGGHDEPSACDRTDAPEYL